MFFRRRTVSLFIFLQLFIGCSEKATTHLHFSVGGAPHETVFWETVVQEFEKKTGISVTLTRQPSDTDQRRQELLISLKAGRKKPDVFLMDVAWVSQFTASGWLAPIKSEKIFADLFFTGNLDLASAASKEPFSLPVYVDGGLLYYRKDLLADFGYTKPPETWKELLEMSLRIQKAQRKVNSAFYGFVWQGVQYEGLICNFMEFAGSQGGFLFQNDEFLLQFPPNRQAISFMHDLIHRHEISPPNTYTEMKEENTRRYFQSGNALFERNWPYAWSLHQAQDSAVQGRTAIASLPHFEGGQSVSTLGGWHIGISKYSEQKKIAVQFVEYILSYDIQKQMALKLGWNPGRKEIYEDPELLEAMPHFAQLAKIFKHLIPRPPVPYYSQISEILQQQLNATLSGEKSAENALSQAETVINRIAKRYRSKP